MSTVNEKEVSFFSQKAEQWSEQSDFFGGLYAMNPARMQFIKQEICRHFSVSPDNAKPFSGFQICDIGCGGGILTEPLAKLGGKITGIDASASSIDSARKSADDRGLGIDYLIGHASSFPELENKFDVITSLEVLEHVDNPGQYIIECSRLLKPGGLIIFSTINRNLKSWALAIVAAENLLKMAPKGTHTWDKFITPEELSSMMNVANLVPNTLSGITINPLNGWKLSNNMDVNYIISGVKKSFTQS